MSVRFKWYGEQTKRAIGNRLNKTLKETAEAIKSDTQDRLNTPYPPASQPGQYPHRRTGRFRRSLRYRVVRAKRMVEFYSKDPKAVWLEYGTRFMAPRPTFRLMFLEFGARLKKAFASTGGSAGSGKVSQSGPFGRGMPWTLSALRKLASARTKVGRRAVKQLKSLGKAVT